MLIRISEPRLQAVRRILMDRWDPFGTVPAVAEKYDELAVRIYFYCFLSMDLSKEQIAAYLADTEVGVLQLPPPEMSDLQACVERLIDEWKRTGP